jgi:hypothetical protein
MDSRIYKSHKIFTIKRRIILVLIHIKLKHLNYSLMCSLKWKEV